LQFDSSVRYCQDARECKVCIQLGLDECISLQ
jgi:hypothetical protein